MYEMIKLPYKLNELEPYISETTLKYHYDILYKGYVDNYNKTLVDLMEARRNNNYTNIKCLEKNLSFNGAGATLHTMYFENLTPVKTMPSERISNRIHKDFGSYNNFIEQFLNSSTNIEGSGWGILGYNKTLDKLIILQCEKHQNLTIWDFIPILVIDMWEHAYYLDYYTDKKAYFNNVLNIINWEIVEVRFDMAICDIH